MISNNIKIRIYGPEVGLKLSIGKTLRRIRPVADRIARPRSPWGRRNRGRRDHVDHLVKRRKNPMVGDKNLCKELRNRFHLPLRPLRQIALSYRPVTHGIDSWTPQKVYKYGPLYLFNV